MVKCVIKYGVVFAGYLKEITGGRGATTKRETKGFRQVLDFLRKKIFLTTGKRNATSVFSISVVTKRQHPFPIYICSLFPFTQVPLQEKGRFSGSVLVIRSNENTRVKNFYDLDQIKLRIQ
jgi:hypothetical protein